MAQYQKAPEQSEIDRRDHKQVHRRHAVGMVAKKRLPPLARRSSPPNHVLGNRCLSDLDAELEQFAVDPWSAPERVGDANVSDHLPNVHRHLRAAATRPRLPSPITVATSRIEGNH